jgi:HK97 gp10 family phage protein
VITVQLVGDDRLIAKLEAMPGRVHDGIARAVTRLGFELRRRVPQKLSGDVLKVRSGSLRSSINTQIEDSGSAVAATVGTNIDYARYHEYGVARSWFIEARDAKALRFNIGGETLFRRRVTHPPLPERSFLRSALAEMAPAIEEELREAVAEAIR